ncbi:MAG: imidazole glycerol phosphate synthase subunit HisH [Planctomycetia bacterium]|nr:imidazole glycerol phosphate synthase subunit HisH [Planctomycetia bacterium]
MIAIIDYQMGNLRSVQKGFDDPIRQAVAAGKPFLGICLGLQLLFDVGYEGGRHEGLGILDGEVVRFELPADFKVPHMGWNQLAIRRPAPLLAGLADGTHCYFVHSFYVVPKDAEVVATETSYSAPFCSMIWRDNLFATQFHPEKSQRDGLRMLKNFAELE